MPATPVISISPSPVSSQPRALARSRSFISNQINIRLRGEAVLVFIRTPGGFRKSGKRLPLRNAGDPRAGRSPPSNEGCFCGQACSFVTKAPMALLLLADFHSRIAKEADTKMYSRIRVAAFRMTVVSIISLLMGTALPASAQQCQWSALGSGIDTDNGDFVQ